MKVEIYYHWRQYDWDVEGKVVIDTLDRSEYDKAFLLLKVVEIEIPDVEVPSREKVVKHKTAVLKEEKQKLQAETQIKLNEIEDKIRQLQSLEFKE